MEPIFYLAGGVIVSIIGYFLKSTIEEMKINKKETDLEIESLKEKCNTNRTELGVLKNDHENKYSHLNSKLDELYTMLRELIVEVKDINRRMK